MKKAGYHQRQGRFYYPNYQRTITTNRKKFCGLLIAGFFIFMMAFSAGPLYAGVSRNGAATVPYPMGASGVAYSSQGGGWSVMGLSGITRQNKHGVPGFTNDDIFELDGMELVYASGSNPRLYHTQRESYQRIRYYNPTSPSTSYWEITTKDGTKRFYGALSDGTTNDSRIEGRDENGDSLGVRVWALKEVKDIDSNSTKYYYNEDTTHGDYYLSKIITGKNGCASYGYSATLLHYETDPNPRVTYGSGSLIEIDQRLRKSTSGYAVEVKMGTSSSGSGGYQASAFKIDYVLSSGGRSLISKITPYGDDGSSPMPASEYEYNDFGLVFGDNFYYANGWGDDYFLQHEKITPGGNWFYGLEVKNSGGFSDPDNVLGEPDGNCAFNTSPGGSVSIAVSMEDDSWGGAIKTRCRVRTDSGDVNVYLKAYISDNGSEWVPAGEILKTEPHSGSLCYEWFYFNEASKYGKPKFVRIDAVPQHPDYAILAFYIDFISISDTAFQVEADMIDMNGDGLPDRVTKQRDGNFNVWLNKGKDNEFSSENVNWGGSDGYYLRETSGSETAEFDGHLVSDLIDMDGDGLPDRVTKHHFPPNPGHEELLVRKNNGSGFDSTNNSWGHFDGYALRHREKSEEGEGEDIIFIESTTYDFIDMNGDGLPDRVNKDYDQTTNTHLYVWLNTGSGIDTGTQHDWGAIDRYSLNHVKQGRTEYAITDMNGDGLPDRVCSDYAFNNDNHNWVWLNTGSGFETVARDWGEVDGDIAGGPFCECSSVSSITKYLDFNRDGLIDRAYKNVVYNDIIDFAPIEPTYLYACLNKGKNFAATIDTTDYETYIPTGAAYEQRDILALLHADYIQHQVYSDLIDIDGDGFPDRVYKVDNNVTHGNKFLVQFNEAGAADLLKTVKNGTGGTITYTYKPADKKDKNPNLKNKTWVVDTVTADDGLGATGSTVTTNYEYYGGLYDTDDREFRGYEKVEITYPAGNKTETHYYQDDVKKGLVKKSMTRDASNYIYNYVYNTYTDYAATSSSHYGYGISGVCAPLLTQVDSYVVDGSTSTDSGTQPYGTTWKRLKLTTSYHSYGDPTAIENFGEVNSTGSDIGYDKTKTTFAYAVDTGYWVIKPYSKYVYGTNGQSSTYLTQLQERYYYDSGTGLGSWLGYGLIDQGRLKLLYSYTGSQWIYAKRFGYDSYGNVTNVQDANGKTTQTVYDTKYRTFPVRSIMPAVSAGTFSSYNYYDYYTATTDTTTISNNIKHGRPSMTRDINGQYTKTYYDSLGRVEDIRKPGDESGDATIQYDYHFYTSSNDPNYVKTTLKDGNGGLVSYTYTDGLGRTVQAKKEGIEGGTAKWIAVDNWSYFSSIYAVSETTAPYFSNSSSFTRPSSPTGGRTKTKSYLNSSLGRVTLVYAPNGTGTQRYTHRFETDIVDANGFHKQEIVDGLGNIERINVYSDHFPGTFDLYSTTTFKYNTGTGQLVKKIEDDCGANVTTTMTYDTLGRKTSTTDPDKGTWNYYYDSYDGYTSIGNLIAQQDTKGQVTKLEYDALSRVTKKTYPGSSNYINYRFDYYNGYEGSYAKGHLARVHKYESGTEVLENAYKYDSRGRSAGEWMQYNNSGGYYTYFSYDSMDRVDTITYPDGSSEVVKHTYDSGGNLEKLGTNVDDDKYVRRIDNDAFGRMTYQLYGNNAYNKNFYGNSNYNYRLSFKTAQQEDGLYIIDNTYYYDAVGNIVRINSSSSVGDIYDQAFAYDHLNRLKAQTDPDFAGGTTSYSYDSINRIMSKTGVGDYTYSGVSAGPHAVTSAAGKTYTYDANGNMESVGSGTVVALLDEDFSGGLPSDWSVTNDGTGNIWVYDSSDGRMEIRYSWGNTEDSKLITKSIDCSSSVGTTLSFDETWRGGYSSQWSDGYVYVSTDGGSNWTEVAHPHHCTSSSPDETVSGNQTIDIASYADGESDVKIAFRYHGNYDWYWYVDNVEVTGSIGGGDLPFSDGFESGSLGGKWSTYTTANGRVRVSTSYPNTGSYSVLLDSSVNGTYSYAAAILTLDLSGYTDADLSFFWREFSDENHTGDGVFISDDNGTNWEQIFSFNNGPSSFTQQVIDLDAAAASVGMSLVSNFKVKFQYYDNYIIATDGYAIDDIEITDTGGGGGVSTTFTYDSANNLVEVSGDVNGQYSYDYAGNRVKKVENGVTTYYINGYYEVEDGTPIKYYYASGQRIARNYGGTLTFYHNDRLGGSSRITNSSGAEVRKLGYMPYGSDAYSSGSGDEPVYKFTGKEQDSTGLYYYGARYYDPALGRFISSDNYGDNYTYCGNNPIMYVDPSGNFRQVASAIYSSYLLKTKVLDVYDARLGAGFSVDLPGRPFAKQPAGYKQTFVAGGYLMPGDKLANYYYRVDANIKGTGATGGHYLDIYTNATIGGGAFGTQKVYNMADPGGSDSVNKRKFEIKHHSGQGVKLVPAQDGNPARVAVSFTVIKKKGVGSVFIDIDTPIPSWIPEEYVCPTINALQTVVGMINLDLDSWEEFGEWVRHDAQPIEWGQDWGSTTMPESYPGFYPDNNNTDVNDDTNSSRTYPGSGTGSGPDC